MRSSGRFSSATAALIATAAMLGINMQTSPSNGTSPVSEARQQAANETLQTRDRLRTTETSAQKFMRLLGGGGYGRPSYPNGPGWSQAKVQRMARKKRNQRRNRRAHRG